MKKHITWILVLIFSLQTSALFAGITTYTFTSAKWESKNGEIKCDGTTDGWKSDKDAYSYSGSYQIGVWVTSKFAGAGATSIKEFQNVRRITLNYATTTKGAGSIHVEIGNFQLDTLITISSTNRDLPIILPSEQSGKIKIQVNTTTNSIYLNQVIIRSSDGISPIFTTDTYQLVTDSKQLKDGDQVIVGTTGTAKYIMGYFDQSISRNNIHAITGKYSADRTMVQPDERAIYTLRSVTNKKGTACWIFQDEIRYEEAYLVASGGQTKNVLALWDTPTSSVYGEYGYWTIDIAANGGATIESQGVSKGKYLQYNASNSPTLFGCYADLSQTLPVIYRRVEAPGDIPTIIAPFVNMGTILLGDNKSGQKTITVNANRLTEDITATIDGDIFTLSSTKLDRDGDELTISYSVATPGKYSATLRLTSSSVSTEVGVLLEVVAPMTIAEANQSAEYATIYLNPVTVTKKFDQYVFITDETGSMLLFDNGDGTGKRYAASVEAGDVLTNVMGKFKNYYGVPEIGIGSHFASQHGPAPAGTIVNHIDSADVCRLITLKDAVVDYNSTISVGGKTIPLNDKFEIGIVSGMSADLTAIVMISWNELVLWPVSQTFAPTDIRNENGNENENENENENSQVYDILGRRVDSGYRGIVIQRGTNARKRLQ